MGSADMAFNKILVIAGIVGSVASQLIGTETIQPTTQVPILRFLDSKNPDGSYTYGFESADGTYKIETRLVDGTVKGKYGYIDPTGELKTVEYGGTSERGFEPQIEGVVLPPPTIREEEPEVTNTIPLEQRPSRPGSRFANFKAREAAKFAPVPKKTGQVVDSDIKVVNGRRAILKKRIRPTAAPARAPAPAPAPAQKLFTPNREELRQQQLRAREQELHALQAERNNLLRIHEQRYNLPTSQSGSTFRTAFQPAPQAPAAPFQQSREVFRSQPAPVQQSSGGFNPWAGHPFISGYDSGVGVYSYSY